MRFIRLGGLWSLLVTSLLSVYCEYNYIHWILNSVDEMGGCVISLAAAWCCHDHWWWGEMTLWLPLSNILLLFLHGFTNLVDLASVIQSSRLWKTGWPAVLSYSLRLPLRGGSGLITVLLLDYYLSGLIPQQVLSSCSPSLCFWICSVSILLYVPSSTHRFPMHLKSFCLWR